MDTLIGFENLGKRLQFLLNDAGYTQVEANNRLGFSPNTIRNYIHGRIPEAKTLKKISKFFEVSMEWLLTGEEKIKYIKNEENQLIQTYRKLNDKQQEKASYYLTKITNAFDGLDNRLKLLIENAGYKLAEVEKGANLTENSISKYLKGRKPDSKTIYQLSKFFEMPMEWFVDGEVIIEGFNEKENQFVRNYRMLKLKEQGKIIGCMDGMILEAEN